VTLRRAAALLVASSVALVAACSGDGDDTATSTTAAPATTPAPTVTTARTEPPATTTTVALAPASFSTAPGVEQVTVTDAEPGTELAVVDTEGVELAAGTVDELGSLLFRGLTAGTVVTVRGDTEASDQVTVMGREETPPASFYAEQRLVAPGFGYIETRDGTTLSATVWLPGDVDAGPYPTVVEYSGYTPSNPDSSGFKDLFTALGYAYVGVNMRGTGCSGGSYRFFEYTQNLDGYDAIEAVAAQPWVLGNRVGLVGVSFPGISQLFVAQTQPPSLAAITPFSVIDDAYRSTLYPGGILNTGFAVEWTSQRMAEAAPEGQEWAAARIAEGDEQCAGNQRVRLQNPDLVAEIRDTPYVVEPLASEIAPRTFVDRIEVPTFIAGAWQDEQTGGRFPTMLDQFTNAPLYASLVNGLHTESVSPVVFARLVEFLDLYVAERVPDLSGARAVAPILAAGIFGTDQIELPPDRFTGATYDEALATFESEPPIHVLFEQGAAHGAAPLTPLPRWVEQFEAWPVPGVTPTSWWLGDGALLDRPTDDVGATSYTADPGSAPATFWDGNSSDLWRTDVAWDWVAPPAANVAVFTSEPLVADVPVVGSGSADLWISADATDTDLEVTLTEVRADGTEVLVQGGWLRASHRALEDAASSELRPVQTHLEADAEALVPDGEPAYARVEIFPFAHVFRAGSRIRLAVDAPGGNRPVWAFETISDGETVTIHHGAGLGSRLVLPVVDSIVAPAGAPACGSLKGQPCRPDSGGFAAG
jgi:hypothetical protein